MLLDEFFYKHEKKKRTVRRRIGQNKANHIFHLFGNLMLGNQF